MVIMDSKKMLGPASWSNSIETAPVIIPKFKFRINIQTSKKGMEFLHDLGFKWLRLGPVQSNCDSSTRRVAGLLADAPPGKGISRQRISII